MAQGKKPRAPRAKRADPLEAEAKRLGVTLTELVDAKPGMPAEPPAPEPEPIPFADAAPPMRVAPIPYTPHRPRKSADNYEPRADLAGVDVGRFIELVSVGCRYPAHFEPILDAARRIAAGETLRIVFSAPRQHGKSTTVHHICAWLHLLMPWLFIQYATYEQTFSEHNARNIRRIELGAGVRISGEHNTIRGWTIEHGIEGRAPGQFIATSIDGRANGYKANLLVIDDPFKGIEDAFSPMKRDAVYDTLRYVFMPCLAPGYSVIVVASRWHDDDLSGRLIKDGWLHIRLPALCDSPDDLLGRALGEPLCPDGPDPREPRTLAFLEELRYGQRGVDGVRRGGMGEHAWAALMQGTPLPPDAALFKRHTLYSGPPPALVAQCIGADLAYSAGAHSDFAVLVHLGLAVDGNVYVTDCWRGKMAPDQYIPELCAWRDKYRDVKMYSYMSGPERGILPLLYQHSILMFPLPARYSKPVRAQKTAQAWNTGQVRLPADAPWLGAFLKVVNGFTGSGDDHDDDEVDALVSGYDMLVGSAVAPPSAGWGMRRCM